MVRDTSNSVLDEDSVENTLTFEKEGNVSSDEESEAKGSRESKDLTPTESSISLRALNVEGREANLLEKSLAGTVSMTMRRRRRRRPRIDRQDQIAE